MPHGKYEGSICNYWQEKLEDLSEAFELQLRADIAQFTQQSSLWFHFPT